jgi:hypothetical protein
MFKLYPKPAQKLQIRAIWERKFQATLANLFLLTQFCGLYFTCQVFSARSKSVNELLKWKIVATLSGNTSHSIQLMNK